MKPDKHQASSAAGSKKNSWDTGTLGRLWQLLRSRRVEFVAALLCAVLASGAQLLAPLLVGRGIDAIAEAGRVDFAELAQVLVRLGVLYAFGSAMQWLVALWSNRLAQRTVEQMRQQAFDKLSRLPIRYYDSHAYGDILSRLSNDIDAVADGLQQTILQLLTGVIVVLGTLGIMLAMNAWIALVVVALTAVAMRMARFVTSRSSRMFRQQSRRVGELNGLAEEMIAGHKEVLLYGRAEVLQEQFERKDEQLYRVGQASQFYSSLVNPTTRLINNVAYVLVGVCSAALALYRGMSVGQMATLLNYATQFARPINEISSVSTQAQAALASARRVFALIDQPPESQESATLPALGAVRGDVVFSGVDFSYVPGVPLIHKLSLQVAQGQTVAIVGPTGAGKTTLVNLLMRFYELDGGQIYVDGQNIAQVTRDSLRQSFAMVLQDTWLFEGTVRENIAYGAPQASEEQIKAAARAARADGFIRRLPEGYDTPVEENGQNLSQGERQLLTIARALLTRPTMLILDEATSSVDTRTELAVQKAFSRAMEGRTSFVIAHRLSTIEHADLILVLRAGQIVEQGTHQELLAKQGFYAQLYQSQFAPA